MRVVVIEDNALLRQGLELLLQRAGWDVTATLADADDLGAFVPGQPHVDLLIADIRLPPTFTDEGIRAAESVRACSPGTGVLLLSQHIEVRAARRLLAQTATGIGYLLKDRVLDVDEFLDSVQRVAAGGSAIDPTVIAAILASVDERSAFASLTRREREVLAMMAEGVSNEAIRDRMVVTAKTVEAHIGNIFAKLGLSGGGGDHRRVTAVLCWLREQGDLLS